MQPYIVSLITSDAFQGEVLRALQRISQQLYDITGYLQSIDHGTPHD